jgi:hypothetical protein
MFAERFLKVSPSRDVAPPAPLRNSDFSSLIDYFVFRRRGHRAGFLRPISIIICGVI